MTKEKDIVNIEDLSFYYDGNIVLDSIDLVIKEKDLLAIIGPNGGGKTTLLKIILGLLRPQSGKVRVFGKDPIKSSHKVGYLRQYQELDRDFPIDVYDAVLMGRYKGAFTKYSEKDRQAASDSLKTLGIHGLKDRHIKDLSGGQLQRMLLARAIVKSPGLLLLDEPLNSIGADMQQEIYELLRDLSKSMAVVFVTHDISAISKYMDKVACLNRKLFYHGDREGSLGKLEEAYNCPIEILGHGVPHRVLKEH